MPFHLAVATVDPAFYASTSRARKSWSQRFDPTLRSKVRSSQGVPDSSHYRFLRHLPSAGVRCSSRPARGRALAAELTDQWPKLSAAFYHGGEPIRVIRPFLEGAVPKPFLLAMTAAGQSALNIPGLDTVVIYDARYGNRVDRGRNVLHRLYLGSNEIWMAGEAGRVPHGKYDSSLASSTSTRSAHAPSSARATRSGGLTCAALGVDARDLDLPVR